MDSHPGFTRWRRNLNKETVSHLYYRVYKRLSLAGAAQQADREGLYSYERKPDCVSPADAILASFRGINQRYRTNYLSHTNHQGIKTHVAERWSRVRRKNTNYSSSLVLTLQ